MASSKSKYNQNGTTHSPHHVILFLSTPRCGTQWFAKNLSEVYPDEAIVLHEPVNNAYNLKTNLGRYDRPAGEITDPVLDSHFDFIDDVTRQMHYIEISWQSIGRISAFRRRFGERLKLVHLYRNPVHVAASLVTHNWYTGKQKERFEKSELDPFDETALLKEYKSRWKTLTLFEKSLYYWTEINLRALEIKYRYPDIPFNSLKFEDLFKQEKEKSRITLIETLSFLGLNYDDQILEAIDIHYDNYRSRSLYAIDWKDLFEHPQTIAVANKLGYSFDSEIDLSRYKKSSRFRRIMLRTKKILQ